MTLDVQFLPARGQMRRDAEVGEHKDANVPMSNHIKADRKDTPSLLSVPLHQVIHSDPMKTGGGVTKVCLIDGGVTLLLPLVPGVQEVPGVPVNTWALQGPVLAVTGPDCPSNRAEERGFKGRGGRGGSTGRKPTLTGSPCFHR